MTLVEFWLSCLGPLFFLLERLLNYLGSNLFTTSLPDKCYYRNASCSLNTISAFILKGVYLQNSGSTFPPMKLNSIHIFRRYFPFTFTHLLDCFHWLLHMWLYCFHLPLHMCFDCFHLPLHICLDCFHLHLHMCIYCFHLPLHMCLDYFHLSLHMCLDCIHLPLHMCSWDWSLQYERLVHMPCSWIHCNPSLHLT